MRVVCDNCGAVYKIADSKLSKDVNKATCKRCGHKIVIYRPGFRPPQGVSAPISEPEPEERTVIRSVEGLDKVKRSSAKVPAIGSLTAELRAISLPGVKAVAPATPATLGPAPASAPPPPRPLPPIGGPQLPLGAPPKGAGLGIPPKDSPPTAHYGGPRPSLPQVPKVPAVPVAPPVVGEGDKTRPMTQPPAPSNGGAPAVMRPARPAPPPSLQTPAVTPPPPINKPASVQRPPSVQTPAIATAAPLAEPPTRPAAVGERDGSAELGVVAGLGAVGLLGALTAAFTPVPLFSAGIALAAFAGATCLLLPIMSQRGRKKGQVFASVFLGLIIGCAIGFIAHTHAADVAKGDSSEISELPDPVAAPDPTPTPTGVGDGGDRVAADAAVEDDGLSEEERAEARKFSGEEIASLGSAEPTPAPRAEPATPAPRPEPTPAPPREVKKEEPTPKPEGRRPVGPGAPPPEKAAGSSSGSSGPSPFVVDTIIRNNASVVRCFDVERTRGTEMSGKIYLKFSIAPDGTVSRARITTSRFAGTSLDQCVSKEVNQLKFPAFEGESQNVRYPFNVL